MTKKNRLSILFSLVALPLTITPLVISCATQTPTAFRYIRGQGSSSVMPILAILKEEVEETMQYLGNGSGEGVRVAIENMTDLDFGMTSSVKVPRNDAEREVWQKNKYRTVTFAIDAIGIAMHLPGGIATLNNERPIISLTELNKIYDLEKATSTTWENLLENENKAASSPDALAATPVAIGRENGQEASGAAEAFWNVMKLNLEVGSTPDLNHHNLIANGGGTSAESNSSAFNTLLNISGGITYVNLGFALNNETDNIRTATIKTKASVWVPSIENAANNKYNWRRPFNIIYSTNNAKAERFADFLIDATRGQKFVEHLDFVALNDSQIASQRGGFGGYPSWNNPDAPGYEGYTTIAPKAAS